MNTTSKKTSTASPIAIGNHAIDDKFRDLLLSAVKADSKAVKTKADFVYYARDVLGWTTAFFMSPANDLSVWEFDKVLPSKKDGGADTLVSTGWDAFKAEVNKTFPVKVQELLALTPSEAKGMTASGWGNGQPKPREYWVKQANPIINDMRKVSANIDKGLADAASKTFDAAEATYNAAVSAETEHPNDLAVVAFKKEAFAELAVAKKAKQVAQDAYNRFKPVPKVGSTVEAKAANAGAVFIDAIKKLEGVKDLDINDTIKILRGIIHKIEASNA